jgi:hypothetical protein
MSQVGFHPALMKITPTAPTLCPIAIAAHSSTVAAGAKIGSAINGLSTEKERKRPERPEPADDQGP